MTLKEQSEYAAKHLGPGRRIYVELTAGKYEVNWRKARASHATDICCTFQIAPLLVLTAYSVLRSIPWRRGCNR